MAPSSALKIIGENKAKKNLYKNCKMTFEPALFKSSVLITPGCNDTTLVFGRICWNFKAVRTAQYFVIL